MKKVRCKLTPDGLKKIKAQQARSVNCLASIDDQMNIIALSEDTSDNVEYLQLRRERINLVAEISRLDDIIESAQIIRKTSFSDAQPGCRVRLENHKFCLMFQLVSSLEANSLAGKVSCSSPLGNSVLNKRVGEEVVVPTPLGRTKFSIIHIS